MSSSDLLVVGHVTRDLIGGRERLGGAAAYAARAASEQGLVVDLVTSAPSDFALLDPLLADPRVRPTILPASEPTTMALTYAGGTRTIHLRGRAPDIDVLPESTSPVVYLAPVAGEVPPSLARALAPRRVVVGLQGWMRRFGPDGVVLPADPPPLEGVHAVVFSELDHPDAEAIAARLARDLPVVALTRGARGATLYADGVPHAIAPSRAEERDPTGAGDVFGVVLAIGLGAGRPPVVAANEAAFVAARSVERGVVQSAALSARRSARRARSAAGGRRPGRPAPPT